MEYKLHEERDGYKCVLGKCRDCIFSGRSRLCRDAVCDPDHRSDNLDVIYIACDKKQDNTDIINTFITDRLKALLNVCTNDRLYNIAIREKTYLRAYLA